MSTDRTRGLAATAPVDGDDPQRRDVPLDGLRGIAILLVVLYHATLFAEARGPWNQLFTALPRYGWSGVDLFFVLSGFLITRILIRQRGASNYFRVFYARRIARIFPLYYAVLVALFWIVPHVGAFAAANDFWLPGASRQTSWYWLYLSNVETAATGRFHHRFLDLTWSLAIEEQFYLFWPLVVWIAGPRPLARICAVAIAGAFALRCASLWVDVHPLAVYVLTPFRVDALAFGALAAIARERDGGWDRLDRAARIALPAAAAVCAALLALYMMDPGLFAPRRGYTLLAHPLMQTVGYSALAAFYAACLVRAMAADARGRPPRLLCARPLLAVGKYSYAMYLLHDPVIAFTTARLYHPRDTAWPFAVEQLLLYALVIALSLAAARVSWALIEAPALRLAHRFRYDAAPADALSAARLR